MFQLAVLMLIAISVFGDQLTLANGDRLSGAIQKLADGKLLVNTDMAGPVVIPWSNVATLVSTQPLYVVMKDGKVLSGSLVDSGKGLRVENNDQKYEVVRDEIAALRSYQEQLNWQTAEERRRAPHLLDPWAGFVDAGISATLGNSDVTTISIGMNASRTTSKDKLTTVFNALYSRNSTVEPAAMTADLKRGGLRYERNLNLKQFGFISLDAEANALAQLEIRTVGGLGFGQHVINSPRNTFDLFVGSTVNRENFTHLVRLTGEALLSEESSHKLNSVVTVRQKVGVFPNLTDTGEYRMTFDSSAVTTLLRWLSWQVSVSDRYISDPPAGTLKNDILLTTGFRFNLPQHK